MASDPVQFGPGYESISMLPVFKCRIGVHNLGPQQDFISENHLTLYMLFGAGACVRVDMKPASDGDYGVLDVRVHNYTQSNTIIRSADVDAVGCPRDFNPQRQTQGTNESRTVEQFITVVKGGMQYFRFLNVNGKALGCRYWM